ncbi:MAG: tetratricopeptide repeat protein [Anaerolineae bacterium]|nr:tetratricopeptide repeat protein [Anaerolineae bacterium]
MNQRDAHAGLSLGYGDYLRFSKLLQERFGLRFSEKRRDEMEHGIKQAFAASTCADMDEYYAILVDEGRNEPHLEQLVNALTISETHFFRNEAQFDALYNHILPEIIARRQPIRTMRVWSAGCASGEEPYSIAIALRELIPDVSNWSLTILATDINSQALSRARKALYGDWAFREERAKQKRPRYFRQVGNRYQLAPEVQSMVTFTTLNLASDPFPAYQTNTMYMDLILCRNVTIYFDQATTEHVTDQFYDALVDGGWLVIGHSEHSIVTYRRFQVRNFPNAIFYQRTGQPTALPTDWDWLAGPSEAAAPQKAAAAPQKATAAPLPARPSPPPKPAPANTIQTGPLLSPIPAGDLSNVAGAIEQAREFMDYGRMEQARDLLLEVLKKKAQHAPACALLGQVYANLGRWEEAEHWCRQAIQSNKLALDAYYTLSLVLQHQGHLPQAIEAMKKVVYIDRKHAAGHFGLADLYYNNGQLPQALKALDNAMRIIEGQPTDELIPGSNVTVGCMKEAIVRQQQRWSAEVA